MAIEFIGGVFTNSVALISDAWHMFTHCFAIGIGLVAIVIARNPPCHHKTFGLYRAEILAAFVNGIFLMLVIGSILFTAVRRIMFPKEILSLHMLLIGIIGLLVNLISIFILYGSHKTDLNVKGVFYHMLADAASSAGVVVAAFIIMFTGWKIIDPLVSLGISILLLFWAAGILRQSGRVLLEMAPEGLDVDGIGNDLKFGFPEIKELFNVHIWAITTNMFVFSAHIQLKDLKGSLISHEELISRINDYLVHKYNIIESTIQIITGPGIEICNVNYALFRHKE